MSSYRSIFALLVCVCVCSPLLVQALDATTCSELGFDSAVARCSHCSILLQHTNLPGLYDECKQCCTVSGDNAGDEGGAAKIATFHRGRLELDLRGLYPGSELARFVNEYANEISGLSVQNVPRMAPRIVLLDEDGNAAETTRIQSWSCDLIVEYLQKKLVPAPAGAKKSFW